MKPERVVRERIEAFTDLPNVGPAAAADFQRLGYRHPRELAGADPLQLYHALCELTGSRQDPCVLDVFMSVTDFLAGNPPRPWWEYTAVRKQRYGDPRGPGGAGRVARAGAGHRQAGYADGVGAGHGREKCKTCARDVPGFIEGLEHPLKPVVLALRQALLGAGPAISEKIKWNAPSFRTREHFATMHLRAKDSVRLILHLGVRSRAAVSAASIPDPRQLPEWLGPGRAAIRFAGVDELERRRDALLAIIRAWIRHVG